MTDGSHLTPPGQGALWCGGQGGVVSDPWKGTRSRGSRPRRVLVPVSRGGGLAQLGAVAVAGVEGGGGAGREEGAGTFLGRSHRHYVRLGGREGVNILEEVKV